MKQDESGTGFAFKEYTGVTLKAALQRAIKTFENKTIWEKIQKNGMIQDYSWKTSAKKYISLYKKVIHDKN